MHEEQAGWRAGDLLTFTLPARVIRVMPGGFLVVEMGDGGLMFSIDPARVVERLA